ncbi:MAG: CapA family protein, partial [Chloroflexi bacterium]|nr:CapA family protein [Chloroflexota bacterium]
HHPHVVQGVEYRADALVAYSLGNFVFYPMAASGTSQGVVLRCLLDVTGVKSAELIPYIIVNAQPTLARGEAAAAVLGTIRRVTASMGAWPR